MKNKITEQLKSYSDTPALDAQFFLSDFPNPTPAQIDDFVMRRKMGEPVAKILGHIGFWTLDLLTTQNTLDPRPDSETLIDAILDQYPNKENPHAILDIGTGSGCLLLAALSEYPNASGLGVDKSFAALEVAQQNAVRNNIDRATFVQKDFTQFNWTNDLKRFDVIISNPPYIATSEIETLSPSTKNFDPMSALDGGSDGLDAYRAIAETLHDIVAVPTCKIFFEIGQGQSADLINIMKKNGYFHIRSYQDLNKIDRVLVFGLSV